MGSIVSFLIFGRGQTDPEDDIVDPKTGFTRSEKKLMKETWDKFIRGDLIDVGVITMLRLLEAHPEIHKMFPDFKDMSLEQLESNKKFHAHCQLIMSTVNNAVDAFLADDVELFATILILTGERHAKRAILARHFESVQDPLLESLKQKMKSHWTDEVEGLWTRAVKKMMEIIISGVDNYNKANKL